MLLSLHDSDMLQQRHGHKYLARSSAILRASVKPALSPRNNHIDRHVRLLLDHSGPSFRHQVAVEEANYVRRVGNLWYTQAFAQKMFEEILLNHAKARHWLKIGTASVVQSLGYILILKGYKPL